MANYVQAFEKVFALKREAANIYSVNIEDLTCWQTMKDIGFSSSELYQLFKHHYCEEIWLQLQGENIQQQSIANLLFKASVKGYVDELLVQFQQCFSLPISGVMCSYTLQQINKTDQPRLTIWLRLYTLYFDIYANQTHLYSQLEYSPEQHFFSPQVWLH